MIGISIRLVICSVGCRLSLTPGGALTSIMLKWCCNPLSLQSVFYVDEAENLSFLLLLIRLSCLTNYCFRSFRGLALSIVMCRFCWCTVMVRPMASAAPFDLFPRRVMATTCLAMIALFCAVVGFKDYVVP